jgi:hypothetical protein
MAKAEWQETTSFIEAMISILDAEHPMTVRQLFYRLVSVGIIGNSLREYQRVSRLSTKARRDERCPFEYIVDRSRPTYSPGVFDDCAQYANVIRRSYRKDHWQLQPNHIEVWSEKDAVMGSIEDTTDELGITVRVARGFMSATRINDIAEELYGIPKPTTILYLGDHDPSGHSIEQSAHDKVQARYLEIGGSRPIEILRLAIHKADIEEFSLPPLRVKDSDSRAGGFRLKFGGECVELDALPPSELRARIKAAVEARRDELAWQKSVHIEQVEIKSIMDIAGKLQSTGSRLGVDLG